MLADKYGVQWTSTPAKVQANKAVYQWFYFLHYVVAEYTVTTYLLQRKSTGFGCQIASLENARLKTDIQCFIRK
ncbi:MAG TPA: hypothetical protein VD884_09120 [Ohtaekwangia sp.]|nr:hypothetical protein [Ohtaekwangia sp.]